MCDTKGCVLPEHLTIETIDVNISRCRCQGVLLLVRAGNATSPGHIIQATPCRHGGSNKEDGFKNSCQKLQIYVQDEVSIQYCKSLLKNKTSVSYMLLRLYRMTENFESAGSTSVMSEWAEKQRVFLGFKN